MLGTVNVYYIFYGNWSSTAKQILVDFASKVGGSGWWNINTTYTNGAGTKLTNSVKFVSQYQYTTSSNYSKVLANWDVDNIVTNTINQNHLPKDPNAVYVVLSSKDVGESSGACGWHTSTSIGNTSIKYAWVGDPTQKLTGCLTDWISLNGDLGADAALSTVAHELAETVTDPVGSGWYTLQASGGHDENADKCSTTNGTTLRASNGAKYNAILGTRKFLLQQNWVNVGSGYCASSYSATDLCPNDPKKTVPGLCGCGKVEPYDVASFHDAQGYACSDWRADDCTQAVAKFGYTAAQQASILTNCMAACGVCPVQ
jgi:hypothetical protein